MCVENVWMSLHALQVLAPLDPGAMPGSELGTLRLAEIQRTANIVPQTIRLTRVVNTCDMAISEEPPPLTTRVSFAWSQHEQGKRRWPAKRLHHSRTVTRSKQMERI